MQLALSPSAAIVVGQHLKLTYVCMGSNSTEGQGIESDWQELNAAALIPCHLMSAIVNSVTPELVLNLAVHQPKDYWCVDTRQVFPEDISLG